MQKAFHREMGFCAEARAACFWLVIMAAVILASGCSHGRVDEKNKDYIGCISFSPDGRKLLFDRRKGEGDHLIHVYDLDTGELSAYQSPPDEQWSMARYSFDGKHIAFVCMPVEGGRLNIDKAQIAVMDPDGKNVKKITSTSRPKIYPSFCHSGDRIIFAKAADIRKKGRTRAAGFDVYEVDIKTGVETRLTHFNVFSISAPYEFPDGETIIFGVYGFPGMDPEIDDTDNVYVVKKGHGSFPKPLVRIDTSTPLLDKDAGSKKPLVSWDGKRIFFQADALNSDGIHGEGDQYYEYLTDGKYHRLTHIIVSSIWSSSLSFDSKFLAVVFDPVFDKSDKKEIAICTLSDGTSRTINLPDHPSRIINQMENSKEKINMQVITDNGLNAMTGKL